MKKIPAMFLTFNLLALSASPIFAQISLEEEFKLNRDTSVASVFGDFGSIISVLLSNILIGSSVLLLFLLIFGGFTVVSSQGKADQIDKGKQAVTGAIIGFIIVFTSYWIVQIIEVITGVELLNNTILLG